MRFLGIAAIVTLVGLSGCGGAGQKNTPNQPPEVRRTLKLDGGAELEFNSQGYLPKENCIQLSKTYGRSTVDFIAGTCDLGAVTLSLELDSTTGKLSYNGTVVGQYDLVPGDKIFDLCSGKFAGVCLPQIQAGAVVRGASAGYLGF